MVFIRIRGLTVFLDFKINTKTDKLNIEIRRGTIIGRINASSHFAFFN